MAKKTTTEAAYQLKIVLLGSKPPIWRRIIVPGRVKLSRLHDILQIVMDWTNSHLHQFCAEDAIYCLPQGNDFGDCERRDERRYRLADIAPREKAGFIYEYDFGDGWEHKVTVEKILPAEAREKGALCVGGRNACPPDDCGGIWGYYRMLDIVGNPKDKEYEEMAEWLGPDFDPRHFSAEEVNTILRELRI